MHEAQAIASYLQEYSAVGSRFALAVVVMGKVANSGGRSDVGTCAHSRSLRYV